MRHPSGGKWFACIMHLQGKLCINLKCDPVRSEFLRRTYKGVYPAWHMNKEHWNTVEVNSVPKGELFAMIAHSFELTAPKNTKSEAHEKNREIKKHRFQAVLFYFSSVQISILLRNSSEHPHSTAKEF